MLRAAFSAYQSEAGRNDLYGKFADARADDRFRLAHNGQVCYLRAALNKRFKSSLGIYFRINEVYGNLEWLYANKESDTELDGHIFAQTEELPEPPAAEELTEAEEQGVPEETEETEETEDRHIYAPNEVILRPTNAFVIYVPADLYATQLDKIKQFVDEYRLVTRTPQYEPINS